MTLEAKCDHVKKLITRHPYWWECNVTDMSLDLMLKLGSDPRDLKYFQLTVIQFIRITDALDNDDPDINAVTTQVAADVHPTVDFHKLGIQDDIVRDGIMMHQRWIFEEMHDDPAMDHPDVFDDQMYEDY